MNLYCLIFVLLFRFCISGDTITINQTLIDKDILISKDGSFALGFFSPGNSSYKYLGIWFHKVPLKTFVWVANRNKPINSSSGVLSVNQHGILALYSNAGMVDDPIWSANFSMEATGVSTTVQLLDSGNLILFQNGNGKILWQSFDYPTDTLLQGMKLRYDRRTGMQKFLTSWKSPDDPGTGDYLYKINPDGAPQIFLYKGLTPYWRTGPQPWTAHLSKDFIRRFANNQDEIYYTFSITDTSIITRIMVDYSGLVKRETWQSRTNQWKDFWFVPMYRCEKYGHCGAYSNCNPSNIDSFECTCLPGYEPKFPQDWHVRDGSSGCVRKRMGSMSMCQNGEGFVKVGPVKIPDTRVATWVGTSMSKMECELACLRNCSCTAYISLQISRSQTGCLTWHGELMDTMVYAGEGYDIHVRVDAIEYVEYKRKAKADRKKKMVLVLVSSLAVSLFLMVIVAGLLIRRRRKMKDALLEGELVGQSHSELPFLKLSTIITATDNFSLANKLGQGGFGTVYKGRLSNGQEAAVKRLSRNSRQGMEEFRNEVTLIARLQHRNLVKLLGYCVQEEERILIYEYLLNRSLDSFLFDQTKRSLLDWRKRKNIIVGIARGILYLHQDSRLRIVHRDLKTSNILLDKDMNPKISDFGMAKIFEAHQIQEKTIRIVGTHGYMSPEYVVFGKFSVKSDVYSFGVILLEIITGKKNNKSYQENPSSLIGHVWELWKEGRALNIVDSSLKVSNVTHEVLRYIQIGLLCVQDQANDRPNMLAVILMLNGETTLPCPKQPAHHFRESLESSNLCSINDLTITNVEAR